MVFKNIAEIDLIQDEEKCLPVKEPQSYSKLQIYGIKILLLKIFKICLQRVVSDGNGKKRLFKAFLKSFDNL